jgi:hypothetical protein
MKSSQQRGEQGTVHLFVAINITGYFFFAFSLIISSAQQSAAETVGNPIVLVSRMIA